MISKGITMAMQKHYNPSEREPKLQAIWEELGIYRFVGERGKPVFSIDTPPATVSGHLHLGHVYSYSQTDFMARFWRMNGYDIFYPMGFDDNGLPTERLVERSLGIESRSLERETFIQKCLEASKTYGSEYRALWERIGLSIDWRYSYRTIDERSRRVSQASFLDLYHKNLVYRDMAPTIWCPECQTALAQADLEDRAREKDFYTLAFKLEDGSILPIATTRPELLPACVAVFIHPDDIARLHLVGKKIRVPLMEHEVLIYQDSGVDRTKGTGVVMCCTFGDAADIQWWRTHALPLNVIIDKSGNLTQDAGDFAGISVDLAHEKMVKALEERNLIFDRQRVQQFVRVHERCNTPVEFLVTKQWFIRVLDFKEAFLAAADSITWYPDHMKKRYDQWVENLNVDWLVSRQRYYGVSFPVWYCDDCGEPVLADENQLPVDPTVDHPRKKCVCGGNTFTPEFDVMDTWATSSLTPQIACGWLSDQNLYSQTFPMSLRTQAHEIIRTWAFYTIVKSIHHFDKPPWNEVAISGWGLAPAGSGKISKSRGGGPVSPVQMIDQYSADAVRYWAASTGFGKDAVISEEKIKVGARLVTKLWNVARFSQKFLSGYHPPKEFHPISPTDRWILSRTQCTIGTATEAFRNYDYLAAKNEVETLFWHDLADNYLEMVKFRLYGEDGLEKESAKFALYYALLNILRLFAPILPHVTDEIFRAIFAEVEGQTSIHVGGWPTDQIVEVDKGAEEFGEIAVQVLTAVRRFKSEKHLPLSTELRLLQIVVKDPAINRQLSNSLLDIKSATRSNSVEFVHKFLPEAIILETDGFVEVALVLEDKTGL